MSHNQSFEKNRYRVAAYVSEAMKTWVAAQAASQGISESQFVAKILEQQFDSSKGKHAIQT